jgi:HK97 family phage major capsid protein/HK97 family phage prohead protease
VKRTFRFGERTVELGEQFRGFKLELLPQGTGKRAMGEGEGESSAEDSTDQVLTFSVASEEPFERWWGTEILGCTEGECNLTRFKSGTACYLYNHRTDSYLGVIGDPRFEKGRLVINVRFAGHELAQQVYRDVKAGILCSTSIGYQILDCREESKGVYRVTEWEPYEASTVTVPADATVGYGRSVDRDLTGEDAPPGRVEVKTIPGTNSEPGKTSDSEERKMSQPVQLSREDEIVEIRRMADTFKMGKEYTELLINLGCSVGEARAAIRDRVEKGLTQEPIAGFPSLGLSDKEQKRYSIARAALAHLDGKFQKEAPFEYECHQEMERLAEKANVTRHGGFLVPVGDLRSNYVALDRFAGNNLIESEALRAARLELQQRATYQATAGTATGGALIYTEGRPLIELLRPLATVLQMGPTILTGLVSNLQIPRQISGSTGYWVQEDGSITQSEATFDFITLSPKTAGSMSAYTRQFLLQATEIPSVEEFVRTDLTLGLALTVDLAAIAGSGTNGVPLGILNAASTNSVVGGDNGAAATWPSIVSFETAVATANAARLGNMGWLMNPKARGKFKTTLKFPASASAETLWMDGQAGDPDRGMVNGYPAWVTNQCPGNLTKGTGTNLSALVFGAWSQMVAGFWSIAEFMADPYTQFAKGGVRMRMFQSVDFAYRQPKAFAVQTDLNTN